jgi:hypothetical protein
VRVNLGVRLSRLFTALFKLSNDGKMELFYKEDKQYLFPVCKRLAKYVKMRVTVLNANTTTLSRRIRDVLTTIYI